MPQEYFDEYEAKMAVAKGDFGKFLRCLEIGGVNPLSGGVIHMLCFWPRMPFIKYYHENFPGFNFNINQSMPLRMAFEKAWIDEIIYLVEVCKSNINNIGVVTLQALLFETKKTEPLKLLVEKYNYVPPELPNVPKDIDLLYFLISHNIWMSCFDKFLTVDILIQNPNFLENKNFLLTIYLKTRSETLKEFVEDLVEEQLKKEQKKVNQFLQKNI